MKYGKKNHVNLNWLSYNIFVLGESKIGKSTLIKEACEKTAGEDGYLFFEIGMERGADAIEGINYINCPTWDQTYNEVNNTIGFADICDDIIENKNKDYPNLQCVIWDTYDQLIPLAEDKAIEIYNRDAEKKAKTINSAWGGYGRGEKYAISLMLDKMAQLKDVGVSVLVIGHVKTKDVEDVVSGSTYQILTSDQQQNYFNALKKNMHIVGLAYIDREFVREKTGKKVKENGKEIDEIITKVTAESRKLKFRDDTYCVDCGGRFANITPEIPLNSDAFIKAIEDAILSEQSKSGISLEQAKKDQAKHDKAVAKQIEDNLNANKESKEIQTIVSNIVKFLKENASNTDIIREAMAFAKDRGYNNPGVIDKLKDAQDLQDMLKKYIEK